MKNFNLNKAFQITFAVIGFIFTTMFLKNMNFENVSTVSALGVLFGVFFLAVAIILYLFNKHQENTPVSSYEARRNFVRTELNKMVKSKKLNLTITK